MNHRGAIAHGNLADPTQIWNVRPDNGAIHGRSHVDFPGSWREKRV
jgi:hypothetical protein